MMACLRYWECERNRTSKRKHVYLRSWLSQQAWKPQLMWQPRREPEQGPARFSNFLLPILWLGIVNTSAKQDGENRDLFLELNFGCRNHESFLNWQQKCEEFGKAQEEPSSQHWCLKGRGSERAEGQPDTSQNPEGRGASQSCSGRKVQSKAGWERVLPKRPAADSLPLFKRKSCLFYQTGRSLRLGLCSLPCPPTRIFPR